MPASSVNASTVRDSAPPAAGIFCGVCGGRMLSRPRDAHTKQYVCAGSRPSHQLAILAQPVDELVAVRVLDLLTTPSFRESLVRGSGRRDDGAVAGALAELGSAQSRLQMLDDDYYIRGALPLRRYRSIRVRLEREVERLHALVDGASRQRIVLHPDPRRLWSSADFGQRRELVRLIVERVEVKPARRGARFDVSRVRLTIPFAAPTPETTGVGRCTPAPSLRDRATTMRIPGNR